MERVTVSRTFNGTFSKTNHLRDRDGSFSPYLRPETEPVPEPDRNRAEDSELSIFDAKKYFNESDQSEHKVAIGNRVSPLSVSDQCDHDLSVGVAAGARFSSASSSVDGGYGGRNHRSRSFHATPTASSEASWNSQTGLLSNPPGAMISVSSNREKKTGSTGGWRLFGRKCPCSGEKSVQIEDKLSSEPKNPKLRLSLNQNSKAVLSPNSKPEIEKIVSISQTHKMFADERAFHSERVSATATGFTFPILSQSVPAKLVLSAPGPARIEDPPRDSVESLEVFRPIPRPPLPDPRLVERESQIFTFPTSPKTRAVMAAVSMAVEEDMASDASSDLFEIESFSTQTTSTTYPIMNHRRDSLDEAANYNARRLSGGGGGVYSRRSLDESVAATECYEPSEASIDWSVTTAEGYDRVSMSNYSELEEVLFERSGGGGGGGGKRRGNGLLSCRCEKAVSVGPHPQPVVKWVAPPPPAVVGKHGHGHGPMGGGRAMANKPPLGRSGSARLSLAFAT